MGDDDEERFPISLMPIFCEVLVSLVVPAVFPLSMEFCQATSAEKGDICLVHNLLVEPSAPASGNRQ